MDYEKSYKEALERAREKRDEYKRLDGEESFVPSDIEYIFPELKESEDERIRKAIHIYLDWLDGKKEYAPKGEYSIRDMIAWLEKQGEKDKLIKELGKYKVKYTQEVLSQQLEKQGEQNKVSIWKHWKNGISGNGEGKLIYLIKDGDTYSLSSCLSFECDYIELSELDKLMIEKQGEKLPVGFYYVNSEGKRFYSDTFKYGDIILHVEKQGEQKQI